MTQFINDSQAVSFLQQTHASVEAELYRVKYPEYNYSDLLFVDTRANEWARTVTFYSSDTVGKAGWFNANSTNMPRADVNMTQHNHSIQMAAIGYGYNLEEISFAKLAGPVGSLDQERMFAARRAYEQFMYGLVVAGDSTKNMGGLINYSGVTATTAPADGTGSATTFARKTGDQIARDINNELSGMQEGSLGIELANTIALPIQQFNLLATKRMGTAGDEITVLEWLMKYNVYTAQTGQPLKIRMLRGLDGAGGSGTDRMLTYVNDRDVVKLHLPMAHKFMPVYQTGPMLFEVPGIFRTGGVEIRRPNAVRYLDGI